MQYPYYGYNPAIAGQQTQKRIADLQNELAMLQNMNNQLYPQQQQQQNTTTTLNNDTGVYVYVNDYRQVVNYPTPADGKAMLFINLDKGIGWSKKFVNGVNVIQSFTIGFLNTYDDNSAQLNDSTSNTTNNEMLDNLMERMSRMEDNFDKILNTLDGKVQQNEVQPKANNQRGQSNSQSSASR